MTTDLTPQRLAAVFSAQGVGHSRLLAADEEAARRLTSHRDAMLELIRGHGGRVLDAVRDHLLAEFPGALEAVRAAVEVQRELARRNAKLPEPSRMAFRIGLHLGDVIVEGERIHADATRVAIRLEQLAPPGGLCVSEDLYRRVQGRFDPHSSFSRP